MTTQFKAVSVIGLGYIGLPTAAVIASKKIKVTGVDVNPIAVEKINRGEIHIVEPDLDGVVHSVVTQGFLRATTTPEPADAFLVAVPTPFKEGYEPDLTFIESAAKSIAPVLQKGNLIVLESTSPVGTTEYLAKWLAEARPDLSFPQDLGELSDIRIAYCPERVLPGSIVREIVENDRVIGGLTPRCSEVAAKLYATFVEGECVITQARTAEMCKLTENSFRDVNIAFANELSLICDKLDINVWELIALANRHPRVNILQPGPGVGGHCIAVDPWFIVNKTPDQARLIRTARVVNDSKPEWVIEKVDAAVCRALRQCPEKSIDEIRIACMGLAFKANIDDLRESPSLDIAAKLANTYPSQIFVVEPNVETLPRALADLEVTLTTSEDAIANSEVIVLLVDHREFKNLDKAQLTGKIVIDTRGIWQK